jgi:hypothetical protein
MRVTARLTMHTVVVCITRQTTPGHQDTRTPGQSRVTRCGELRHAHSHKRLTGNRDVTAISGTMRPDDGCRTMRPTFTAASAGSATATGLLRPLPTLATEAAPLALPNNSWRTDDGPELMGFKMRPRMPVVGIALLLATLPPYTLPLRTLPPYILPPPSSRTDPEGFRDTRELTR